MSAFRRCLNNCQHTDNVNTKGIKMIDEVNCKAKSKIEILRDYCVVDIETTGLDATIDEIIELSAIKVENNEIADRFSCLIKPKSEISDFISCLTGITNEMVKNAKSIEEVLLDFKKFIDNYMLVGHNLKFDVNFLNCQYKSQFGHSIGNDYVDTMRLSRLLFKELENHKLLTLANFLKVQTAGMHRAAKDCLVTMQCYEKMKSYISDNGIDTNDLLKRKRNILRAKDVIASGNDFDVDNLFYGQECVFTGALGIPRKEAMQMVVDVGGKCADSVTQRTRYLIVGNLEYISSVKGGKSAKLKKAESLILNGCNIEIISENVFYNVFDIAKDEEIDPATTTEKERKHVETKREFVEGIDYSLDEDKAFYYSKLGTKYELENELYEAIKAYEQAAYYGFLGNHVYDRLCVLYKKTNQPNKIKEVLEFAVFIFDNIVSPVRCDRESKLNKYLTKLGKL